MYMIALGPVVYDRYRDGTPFTLVSALREVRGVGQARVLRADGSVAVEQAGSDTVLVHSSGRQISRRKRAS